ncbi:MAG: type II toxin-antitoxin system VapC family toxin, partial [Candidatus Binatia bacterium]
MSERYVVDASVVIKLFVDEDLSEAARKLLEGMASPEPDEFFVPDLLFPECSNVLWKYVRFHG